VQELRRTQRAVLREFWRREFLLGARRHVHERNLQDAVSDASAATPPAVMGA
jgi:hypothetical protein